MNSPFYMLSCRALHPYPAQGCVAEFEDVLAETLGATIVSPTSIQQVAEFVQQVEGPAPDLLVVALYQGQLVECLQAARGWRSRFGRVWGYLFDSAFRPEVINRSKFQRRLSRFHRTFASLDHLFVSCRGAVEMAENCYPIPVSYVPLAANVKKFGTDQALRPITVNGYGRQHEDHLKALALAYNNNQSDRSLYFTSHMSFMTIGDMAGHRAFFWKMLSLSRIALAYDIVKVKGGRSMPFTFVGQRWFESLAAGCVVVGYRPDCVEADELLNWEDATIDCPADTSDFIEFIDDLLRDGARLDAARVSNFRHMAAAHDWSHRIPAMLEVFGMKAPPALLRRQAELFQLTQRAGLGEGIAA